ncbi:hypothetical protein [Pseudomonas sp. HMWF021]|uniref:hypothetical protein n=1 Tax=Pseudomonas sp. HMWF021 TaxID=2056857 RepID=UPI000D35C2E2|nr:hypothetical protein [Pseudomonas sp. HMWF021]PTT29408.1 hypothetical protein DBR18_13140 [Pseudomonas sp. HMWF021]
MNVTKERKTQQQALLEPWPAPYMIYPEPGEIRKPSTLLLGSGIPEADVEVWSSDETQLHGKGRINKNGRWAFSVSGDLAAGPHVIKARQTFNEVESSWSEHRSFDVDLEAGLDVPAISEPREGESLDQPVIFKGDARQPGGMVDILDLDRDLWIAYAVVDTEGHWVTETPVSFSLGEHRISAIQRVNGKKSDWARMRTFTVSVGEKGKQPR